MRPKSEIYTPKQDDEHPQPLKCGAPPPLPPPNDERSRSIRTAYRIYKHARLAAT